MVSVDVDVPGAPRGLKRNSHNVDENLCSTVAFLGIFNELGKVPIRFIRTCIMKLFTGLVIVCALLVASVHCITQESGTQMEKGCGADFLTPI